ncbi:MAG: triose-phosphate isomerase [Candidatus Moranbacteria bacterium CG23_combo_of_CG06-09_8_20_14_all_40_16]|nr:MAG: triose-phosphate isomerase [Candidatus Moranbacteria bacterium CG23_combo_of_CG06-09_8_20_14_all_40_16]
MKIVIGNLKMNLNSPKERERYLSLLKKELTGQKLINTELILLPSFIHLEAFRKSLSQKVKIGAQNFFFESKGPFTGEISPLMLSNLGCEYALAGHSERRRYFLEKNEEISLKIIAAMKNGIAPILCVGETKVEKENQETLKVISTQLKECLKGVSRTRLEKIVIAYEPVWAIGADITPSPHEIMEAKVLIRKVLVDIFGKKYAELARIIYGGSVNAKNLEAVCLEPEMDGILIGRESLLPHELIKIAKMVNE